MKELSIEEKAKRYDELLTSAKNTIEVNQTIPDIVDCVKSLFPELTESRDEEIRKSITEFFKNYSEKGTWKAIPDVKKWIDWLEKQCSQNNDEDVDILHRFSFYSYKDDPNVLYLSGFYVNEEYRNKGIGTKILEVTDEVAKSLNCYTIRLKTKKGSDAERLYRTHGYNSLATEDKDEIWLEKQDEHKSNVNCLLSWSEEDDRNLSIAIQYVFQRGYLSTVNWLKSLKERYTWKPSEKQISALEWQVKNTYEGSWQYIETKKLLEQLKRLM